MLLLVCILCSTNHFPHNFCCHNADNQNSSSFLAPVVDNALSCGHLPVYLHLLFILFFFLNGLTDSQSDSKGM